MKIRMKYFPLICLSLALSLLTLRAQSSAGSISGYVRDSSGAVVAGVALQARQPESGVVFPVTSNPEGRYEFLRLPPGQYEIFASYQGFQPAWRKQLSLGAGQAISMDLTLAVGGVEQSITVTGEAARLDLSSPNLSHNINEIAFTSLPLNGRSIDRLAQLVPGMLPMRAEDLRGINGFTQKISSNGARGSTFLLDGTDLTHGIFKGGTPGGVSGLLLGMDSVQEFEVLTDAYPAYLGNTGGAVVNVITRRGTSSFHGSLFEYDRNSVLDARNFFDSQIPSFHRHQFGGSAGGPLPGKGNTFFLGYEGLREQLGVTLFNTVPNLAARAGQLPGRTVVVSSAIRPVLDRYPLPNGSDFGDGSAQYGYQRVQPTDDQHVTARTDFSLGSRDGLFVRYTFLDSAKVAPLTLSVQGFSSDLAVRNQYVTAEENHIFSSRLLNSLQLAFNRTNYRSFSLTGPGVSGVPPLVAGRSNFGALNIRSLTSFGTDTAGDLAFPMNQYELTDALRYATGKHDLRLGFNWKHYRSNGKYDFQFDGLLVYNNLASFLINQTQRFVGAIPGSDSHKNYRQNLFAIYVNDQYRWNSQLTVSYGLRYEWFTVPVDAAGRLSNLRNLTDTAPTVGNPLFKNPSLLNFAPRVGLAWNVAGRDRTVIRAGLGIFYDAIQENLFGYGARIQPPYVTIRTITLPPYPNSLSSANWRVRLDPFAFTPSTPYILRYHLTLQRTLAQDLVLTAGYIGSRGVHLALAGDLNSAAPVAIVNGRFYFGPATAPRRNPNFDLVRYTSTDANSTYNSLQVGLSRRWSHGLQFGFNYTYGRSIDDASSYRREFTNSIADQPPYYYDRGAERALSNFQIPHNAIFHSTWDLPWKFSGRGAAALLLNHWQVAGIATLSGGTPFTVNASFDIANNNQREGQRPDLAPGASNNPVLGGSDHYYDVSAFRLQPPGYLGNLGRNTLVGPGYASADLVLTRNIPLTEGQRLQFRLEAFNLFNRVNFALPGPSGTGGIILFTALDGVPAGNATKIFSTVGSSRQLQLSLRWSF